MNCTYCHSSNIVFDYRRASAICTACGSEIGNMDHNFYGNTINDLSRAGLSKASGTRKSYKQPILKLMPEHDTEAKLKLSSEEKRKIQAFEHIDIIADNLRLNDEASDLAKSYFEKIESSKCKKCKKLSLLAAACISLVIKTRRMNITFKELACNSENVRAKEIMKLNHSYSKLLNLKKHFVSLSDTISKYSSIFCLDYHQETFAFSMSEFIQKHEIIPGNNPFSCISVIMYSTCLLVEPIRFKENVKKRSSTNWKLRFKNSNRPYDDMSKMVAKKLLISINTLKKSLLIFYKYIDIFFTKSLMKKYKISKNDLKFTFESFK